MATNSRIEKVTVEISGSLNVSETTKAAKQLNDIVSKSAANKDAQKASQQYIQTIANAEQKINQIRAKGTVNQKELNAVKKYLSDIETAYRELENLTQGLQGKIPVADAERFAKQFKEISTNGQESIKKVKSDFEKFAKDATGKKISFIDAPEQIQQMKDALVQTATDAKNAAEEKARIEMETLPQRQKVAQELINKELESYRRGNNKKYEDYKTFIADTQKLESKVAKAKKAIIPQAGISAEATKRIPGILQGNDEQAKALGIQGINTAKELNDLWKKGASSKEKISVAVRNQIRLENEANKKIVENLDEEINKRKESLKVIEKQADTLEETPKTEQDIQKAGLEAGWKVSTSDEYKKKEQVIRLVEEELEKATKAENDLTNETNQAIIALQAEEKAAQDIANADLDKEFEKTASTAKEAKNEIAGANTVVVQTQTAMTKAKLATAAFGKITEALTSKFTQMVSAFYLFQKATQIIGKAVSTISTLDKQITDIGIVTKQTGDEIWSTFDTFNKAAKDLSTTTLQYLEGAKIFYQQGMNTAEVMKMVEATTKAAALSGVSFTAASETLTAAINGYNMAATEAMTVTDKFAAVGAASASDFAELSTAMEKVASQAYSSGMSFDSLLGILAKGIETTREAPEAIGTGLKSIIARFQEMKENPMADLEDGINANRVEKALKTVGVQLRDTNGEFRNMDDVFADLGESWKTMSRNQRAYISTMAAGSR